MRAIVNGQEMKYYDRYTIEKIEILSLLLMERAALELVRAISPKVSRGTRIAVFAGCGNNGGDALAAGRILSQQGAEVFFYMPGELSKVSRETEKQIIILQNLGFSIHDNFCMEEYDIVIDGLFGIGLTREIEGIWKEAIDQIGQLKEKGAYIVAVDIPSGICADSGKVLGCAARANLTVTFEYAKAGHYFYPGREYTGELQICPIGIVGESVCGLQPSFQTMDDEEIKELLPVRNPSGNKGTFGRVLLLAGSLNMAGAAILCGKAILRAGAGMVKIITPAQNREILQIALPEAMLFTYENTPDEAEVTKWIDWADVLVAGPGIGKGEDAFLALSYFLKQGKKPLVIDADALNLIAEKESLKQKVKTYDDKQIIMTPHPGEFVRLSGITMEAYKENPGAYLKELADEFSCIMVGKDAVTLVMQPREKTVYMNLTGNDGMATAGSGDVLAGIIGGLLAQKTETEKAAMLGVYLHGRAGDKAARVKSHYGVTASDIIEYLW